jgi:hypothetical protein
MIIGCWSTLSVTWLNANPLVNISGETPIKMVDIDAVSTINPAQLIHKMSKYIKSESGGCLSVNQIFRSIKCMNNLCRNLQPHLQGISFLCYFLLVFDE